MAPQYKYELGDLVVCKYDFEHLYYPSYLSDTYEKLFFIGIILSRREQQVIFFGRDVVYEVLCTDGIRRHFAQWELEVLRRAKNTLQLPDK